MLIRRLLLGCAASLLCAAIGTAQTPPLQTFISEAEALSTDSLYVSQDGKALVDWNRGERKPIELMSAVKSIVALAIGRLLHDGKLTSLDQPVHTYYPEWHQGKKKLITVRHLMSHTSGLQNVQNAGAEIYPAPDAVRLALAAELDSTPGAEFSYNNKAVNLLAGIIEKVSGLRMDLYVGEKLFQPLGITDFQWYFDKSGTPHAMAGLRLYAADAARLAELVLNDGVTVSGERLLAREYVAEMLAPGQTVYPLCGLLWWRHADTQTIALRTQPRSGPRGAEFEKLEALARASYTSRREVRAALQREVGPDYESTFRAAYGADWFNELFNWQISPVRAYYAEGFLGQYVVVVPAAKLVAVRQVAQKRGLNHSTSYAEFPARVVALADELTKHVSR